MKSFMEWLEDKKLNELETPEELAGLIKAVQGYVKVKATDLSVGDAPFWTNLLTKGANLSGTLKASIPAAQAALAQTQSKTAPSSTTAPTQSVR